jgi:hypothetical protein
MEFKGDGAFLLITPGFPTAFGFGNDKRRRKYHL